MYINIKSVEGEEQPVELYKCPAGEDLIIRVECVDTDGFTPIDQSGSTMVMGWAAPMNDPAIRIEHPGSSGGISTFAFTASQTQVLEFKRARFDLWTETGTTRFRVVGVNTVSFCEGIAPPEANLIYYGVGPAGLTSVAQLTEAAETSLDLTFTVSPSHEKVYFAWETVLGTPVIEHDGFELDALPVQSITVNGVAFSMIESTNHLTATSLDFVVTEAP
jgi:hypothetical protein